MNLIGNFGDPNGVRPNTVTVVGKLEGRPPLASKWRPVTPGLTQTIVQIEAGPDISDAWRLTPAMLQGDRNACTVGRTFVRVVWSNGMTAYPGGTEVGDAAVKSYRALFTPPERCSVRFESAVTSCRIPTVIPTSFNGLRRPILPPWDFLASDLVLTSSHASQMPFTDARALVTVYPR